MHDLYFHFFLALIQDEYEVVGDTVGESGINVHHAPRRSRQDRRRALLDKFEICCLGEFDMLRAGGFH